MLCLEKSTKTGVLRLRRQNKKQITFQCKKNKIKKPPSWGNKIGAPMFI